ncbi:1-pyrroline-5-carboxylate dehydrogenase [Streptomyces sp. FT05W]|jgi:1-pyrroline-5-carboxylate dehydrogenase|uniref:L-glutamate gamma-semialdehyde dehydrogenase n=2 Tax=Streptomyces TaxID=1883 RepID=A0A8D4BAP0_STRFA|nr:MULTISPECIES: L-glutamate gamma-semialdehyde dehydrogenase [Streptomyces]MBD2833990.1 L-glutamate gamma-semialdehyde dehydrogenase [Streptomyces pratensis]RAS31062.1 delta-1-pyrroline-5-carboxylate dehydrogenase [Streptomyces avidinii]TPM82041.1 L-glutamate gamma-semialdehyde dehydrogenase [Mesorhizobium sp. B2-3-3]SNX77106.1 delta-1-pyrroline-5-carboxylate dehydrogenase [Streptomyces microflavus]AGJ57452.1 delta-1-pyrroline-5-carboxylate dehydrogenase [Streptomyces sp. PAMC 26508]
MDAVTQVPAPVNEPVHSYAPGTAERARLEAKLKELAENPIDLPMTIGGEKRMGGGERVDVVQPHNHKAVIGTFAGATEQDAQDAVDAALAAAPAWRAMSFDDRAAIILRAAELLSGPWRETLAASTMLGQGKTAQQAEIDCPCELVDFWRFNVHYARQILAEQPPANSPGVWNRMDHRPLEGFVYAITPFNFSAIAANLPTAPALMGNVVVWKPSPTQTHAAVLLMQLLEEAGLPKGVINLVTGDGIAVSEVALNHRDLAGVHFTGSTPTFQHLWKTVGNNIANYRTYPRLVGETGGKDFVVAHPSADRAVLKTALTRGSFEYQGQKCSASSRAYVPASIWNSGFKEEFAAEVDGITMGDVTDLSHFMGAVIDARSFAKNKAAIDRAAADPTCTIVAGGTYDDSVGYFVRPTVIVCDDPANEVFTTEYFGPILAVHVYEDEKYDAMLEQMESVSDYALTGAVISNDRAAAAYTMDKLRYAAGNFYINDKSTGAVVGQQPFGGGRGSGTNDKAGAPQNLQRWTLTRAIKETLVPPTEYTYPHQG